MKKNIKLSKCFNLWVKLTKQIKAKYYFRLSFTACSMLLSFCNTSCVEMEGHDNGGDDIIFRAMDSSCLDIEYRILSLCTPDNMIISDISSFDYVDDRIYILDYNIGLVVFTKDGEFISKVGAKGNGRGEYISPSSFTINKENNIISIVDDQKGNVVNYDLDDYGFINNRPTPLTSYNSESFGDITVWENNDYASTSSDVDINKNYYISYNEILGDEGFSNKVYISGIKTGPSDMIYKYKDNIRAYSQHSPSVFSVDKNGILSTRYNIYVEDVDYAPSSFLRDISQGARHKDFYNDLLKSDYITYSQISENKNNLLFMFRQKGNSYWGVYDKNEKSTEIVNVNNIKEKHGITFDYFCGACDNQYVFAYERGDDGSILEDNPFLSDEFISATSNNNNNLILVLISF